MQSEAQHEERHPKDLNRIILSIYALSKKAIDDVLTDIEEVIKEYIIDKVLDSEKDQENIAKLNEAQVNAYTVCKRRSSKFLSIITGHSPAPHQFKFAMARLISSFHVLSSNAMVPGVLV